MAVDLGLSRLLILSMGSVSRTTEAKRRSGTVGSEGSLEYDQVAMRRRTLNKRGTEPLCIQREPAP